MLGFLTSPVNYKKSNMETKQITIDISKDKEGLRINGDLVKVKIKNGIVSIENYSTGCGHSCHPNIDSTGSVSGMKAKGYWDKKDEIVRAHGFIYNKSAIHCSDPLDEVAYAMEYHGFNIPQRVIEAAEKETVVLNVEIKPTW
jgi:hypothetical protein